MDKSEGTDFISKTFSSVSDAVSKWYHTSQKRISLASLKRARGEKVNMLGNKVFEYIKEQKQLTTAVFREEYDAIVRMDEQIVVAIKDIEKIKSMADAELEKAEKGIKNTVKKPKAKKANTEKAAETKATSVKRTDVKKAVKKNVTVTKSAAAKKSPAPAVKATKNKPGKKVAAESATEPAFADKTKAE